MQRISRVKKEMKMLSESPPYGVSCYPVSDDITHFEAQIIGGEGTPYAGGIFKLEIDLPDRYPFEPPKVQFVTPIYHPNIDNAGRICLDTLKMPPKGAWKPCLNLVTVLTSLQLLMAQPNADDALMADIAVEFKQNRSLFVQKAMHFTAQYANDAATQTEAIPGSIHLQPSKHTSLTGQKLDFAGKVQTSPMPVDHSPFASSNKRTLDLHLMQDLTNKKTKF